MSQEMEHKYRIVKSNTGDTGEKKLVEVHLEKEEDGGYSISVPDIPGLFTQADTLDEAMDQVIDALREYYLSYIQDGEEFPYPMENMIFDLVEI